MAIDIIVGQNNIEMLKALIARFPKETEQQYVWHFMNDDRWTDLKPQIEDTVANSLHPSFKDFKVYSGKEIISVISDHLELKGTSEEFLQNYRMSMKMAGPIWVFDRLKIKRFFYLDDDVVIMKEPAPLWEHHAIVQSFWLVRGESYPFFMKVCNDVYEMNVTPAEWNKRNANGVTIVDYLFWAGWKDIMHRVYTHPDLLDLWQKYAEKQFKFRTGRLWFIDQFMYCFKAIQLGAHICTPSEAQTWAASALPKKWPPTKKWVMPYFIHYSNGKGKLDHAKFFQELV